MKVKWHWLPRVSWKRNRWYSDFEASWVTHYDLSLIFVTIQWWQVQRVYYTGEPLIPWWEN